MLHRIAWVGKRKNYCYIFAGILFCSTIVPLQAEFRFDHLKKSVRESCIVKYLTRFAHWFKDAAGSMSLHSVKTSKETLKKVTDAAAEQSDMYAKKYAWVREGQHLSPHEEHLAWLRKAQAKDALEKFLSMPLAGDEVPTIAFCFSGGGFRAMIETIGCLQGAEQTGFLDAVTYASGLSGSSWALVPWILSDRSIDDFLEQLIPKIERPLSSQLQLLTKDDVFEIFAGLLRKYKHGQPINLVDIFGSFLAQILLKGYGGEQRLTLDTLIAREGFKAGKFPIPICTAVQVNQLASVWFEWTPWEFGSFSLGAFIPSGAFGRVFEKGISMDSSPKPSLGYLMGIWGSAFAIDMDNIMLELTRSINSMIPGFIQSLRSENGRAVMNKIKESLQALAATLGLHINLKDTNSQGKMYRRFSPAVIANFTAGLSDQIFREEKTLTLVDGGFDVVDGDRYNLALYPLLHAERGVDIVVICDSSADLVGAPALRAAERRAQEEGRPFPSITYEGIEQKPISIFQDEDNLQAPLVVYMPGIANPTYGDFDPAVASYTATKNFYYTEEQTRELSGLMAHNFVDSSAKIGDAIRERIVKKRQRSIPAAE